MLIYYLQKHTLEQLHYEEEKHLTEHEDKPGFDK